MNVKNTVTKKQEEAFSFLKDNFLLQFLLRLITGIIKKMKDSLNIAVAGATGYVGLELIKILSKHPKVKIIYLCATKSIGKSVDYFDKKMHLMKCTLKWVKYRQVQPVMKQAIFPMLKVTRLKIYSFGI